MLKNLWIVGLAIILALVVYDGGCSDNERRGVATAKLRAKKNFVSRLVANFVRLRDRRVDARRSSLSREPQNSQTTESDF